MQTDSAQKPENKESWRKKMHRHVMLTKGMQEQYDATRKHKK
jgi:isochorismate hydrolase